MVNASAPDNESDHDNDQPDEDHDYSSEEYLIEELQEDYRELQAEPEESAEQAIIDKRASLCLEISASAEINNLVRHKAPAHRQQSGPCLQASSDNCNSHQSALKLSCPANFSTSKAPRQGEMVWKAKAASTNGHGAMEDDPSMALDCSNGGGDGSTIGAATNDSSSSSSDHQQTRTRHSSTTSKRQSADKRTGITIGQGRRSLAVPKTTSSLQNIGCE